MNSGRGKGRHKHSDHSNNYLLSALQSLFIVITNCNSPENSRSLHASPTRAQVSCMLLMSAYLPTHRLCVQFRGVGCLLYRKPHPHSGRTGPADRWCCLMIVKAQSAYWDSAHKVPSWTIKATLNRAEKKAESQCCND